MSPGNDLDGWSDTDLIAAWADSTKRLTLCSSLAVASIAAERQRYLDELEGRYPERIRSWLASSPTTADSPPICPPPPLPQ